MTMKSRFALVLLAAFVLPMLLARSGASSPRSSPGNASSEAQFKRGKDLVESNCAECEGATREVLLRGIDDLQAALRLHYHDSLAVHRSESPEQR